MNPRAEIIMVTPRLAAEWLAREEVGDRAPAAVRVRRYARVMLALRWTLGWDAIAFDTQGRRRNGRHRLMALVLAGEQNASLQVPMLVLWDVPELSVDTGDQGGKRTMTQVLKRRDESDPGALASALRLMWQFLNGYPIGARSGDASPDVTEMSAVLNEHPGLRDQVSLGRQLRKRAPLGSDGLGTLLAYLFTRVDADEADVFLDKLITGADLEADDPILVLKHELLKLQGQTSRSKGIDVTHKAALCVKAFNIWRDGERVSTLRWRRGGRNPEPFPVIAPPQDAEVPTT